MVSRLIKSRYDLDQLIKLLEARPMPYTVDVTKRRTINQNRLQRLWLNEIADQLGDRTAEEVRGECKLTIGVPILRAQNETFREKYDRIIRPLPYETKLEMMMEPLDFPVTRLMTTEQNVQYLDEIARKYSAQGVGLTAPEGREVAA